MTTVLQPDEAGIESRTKRAQNRAACFLHLRDLVYLHPKAASADAIAVIRRPTLTPSLNVVNY
jgi:hypothetical protein